MADFGSGTPRRSAMAEIDALRESVKRLNDWVATLHKRIEQLEHKQRG